MDESRRAGGSAQRKYKEMTKTWHRRKARVFATTAVICLSVGVISFVVSRVWTSQAWMFGFFGGTAFAFFLCVWWSPPGWIENWEQGAWGEEATGKVLGRLDQHAWRVVHDIQTAKGNIDHVVVGTGGVFVLDSKRPDGLVEVHGETVRVRRFEDPDLTYTFPTPPAAARLAAQTSARMAAATRIRLWVVPVIVVWGEFPQRLAEGKVVIIHGDELVEWLRQRPPVIAPENVDRIAAAVRAAWSVDVPT